ncbi:MAG: lysylphosphatidylglycerol synthase transmembrane domain-containing protein [bacterium]|nr:lysylphosphatidylglycerol synthase transmembrane domain-containing protein [bacterium]
MRKKMARGSKIATLAGTVIIILMAIVYSYAIRDQLHLFTKVSCSFIPYLFSLSLFMVFSAGVTNAILLYAVGFRLSFTEIFTLSILTTFFNYFGPLRAGAAIRATYLKNNHGMPFSAYGGLMAANMLFILFTAGLICILMFPFFKGIDPRYIGYLLPLTAGLILFPVLMFILRPNRIEPTSRLRNILSLAVRSINVIFQNPSVVILVVLSIVIQYASGAFLIYFSYRTFSIDPDYLSCLAIGVFQSLSNFITLTPNNLGLQEFITGFIGKLTLLGFNQSLMVAAVLRLCNIIVVFVLAPLCWFILFKRIKPPKDLLTGNNSFTAKEMEHD